MLHTEKFDNELMSSNCYVVWDDETRRCVVIDPASEKSIREIAFIEQHQLTLDYIILTHEHTDHTWGVNALLDKFGSAKVVCHRECASRLDSASSAYFRLYYDNPDYSYSVKRVDIVVADGNETLMWDEHMMTFWHTPGHSAGSVCISIGDWLFTGDTIMQYKPYVDKQSGSREQLKESVKLICNSFAPDTVVCPGHGIPFQLKDKDHRI